MKTEDSTKALLNDLLNASIPDAKPVKQSTDVWSVYNLLRSTALSSRYYETRLFQLYWFGHLLDVLITFMAMSAVLLFGFDLHGAAMHIAFHIIIATTAVLSAIRPVLRTNRQMMNYQSLRSGYQQLNGDLQLLVDEIKIANEFNESHKKEFLQIARGVGHLMTSTPQAAPNDKLIRALNDENNKPLPPESFFIRH